MMKVEKPESSEAFTVRTKVKQEFDQAIGREHAIKREKIFDISVLSPSEGCDSQNEHLDTSDLEVYQRISPRSTSSSGSDSGVSLRGSVECDSKVSLRDNEGCHHNSGIANGSISSPIERPQAQYLNATLTSTKAMRETPPLWSAASLIPDKPRAVHGALTDTFSLLQQLLTTSELSKCCSSPPTASCDVGFMRELERLPADIAATFNGVPSQPLGGLWPLLTGK
ncbi:hypothetical protein AB6A40_006865 [Gnathostoma spinigerum]|uniref:Uncharacterized protein n=1 Tax=Gnathostoma spinigerum TaxID=75299 RepID=A0ABD6ERS8_9BILA